MPYSKINNLNIFYYENNREGIPLLFIHGWLGRSSEWVYQFSYFNSKNHIIILDLPGFGRSDKPKIKYSIKFFTETIIDFLNLAGFNEVHLIGHSLGGLIAQNIAFLYPDMVRKLILISTPYADSRTNKEKFLLFFLKIFFRLAYKKVLEEIIKRIIDPKADRIDFQRLFKYALKLPKSTVLSSFKNMNNRNNPKTVLNKISQPTLIIHGNKDKIVTNSMINTLHDALPISQLSVIEDGAHRVMYQNHEKINKVIEGFINT